MTDVGNWRFHNVFHDVTICSLQMYFKQIQAGNDQVEINLT